MFVYIYIYMLNLRKTCREGDIVRTGDVMRTARLDVTVISIMFHPRFPKKRGFHHAHDSLHFGSNESQVSVVACIIKSLICS